MLRSTAPNYLILCIKNDLLADIAENQCQGAACVCHVTCLRKQGGNISSCCLSASVLAWQEQPASGSGGTQNLMNMHAHMDCYRSSEQRYNPF